jgi:hypothetical protein
MSLNRAGTVRGIPSASLGGLLFSSSLSLALHQSRANPYINLIGGGGNASGNVLHLTPEEAHIYAQLFNYADSDREGILRGQKAVSFFQKSKLPASVLGEVSQIVIAIVIA